MLLTAGFMVVEAVGGLLAGSLALLADAGHMLTDAAALAFAWLAFRLARRPADAQRSYGYHRFQVLAAFGASQLAGGLPGPPGGVVVVEGTLGLILVAYGIPGAAVVAPVLVFRVISYWLPSALGLLAGGSTFLGSDAARRAREPREPVKKRGDSEG